MKAALFDVGDTLVEHWVPREVMVEKTKERLRAALGDRDWIADLADADVEPPEAKAGWPYVPEHERQETLLWYGRWFGARGIELNGDGLDRIRCLLSLPLEEIAAPAPGALDALRWCADRGLRVVLVTNTLARDDAGALEDWQRFGLEGAIHAVVTSHSVGWRKPHPAIFERALELAGARADEAFHVGDNIVADVWGAKRAGLRAIWRDTGRERPPLEVEPDAVVRDLGEVPAVVARWLDEGDGAAT